MISDYFLRIVSIIRSSPFAKLIFNFKFQSKMDPKGHQQERSNRKRHSPGSQQKKTKRRRKRKKRNPRKRKRQLERNQIPAVRSRIQ